MSKGIGISVSLPLVYSNEDGPYKLNKNVGEVVRQNLKNLVLTVPGERIMLPSFGAGLHQVLFDPMVGDTYDRAASRLYDQVGRYMPFVNIESLAFLTSEDDPAISPNQVVIVLRYNLGSTNSRDVLKINATNN